MSDTSQPPAAVPPDDPHRRLMHVRPDAANAVRISVGHLQHAHHGADTNGRYCLIDMRVPSHSQGA